MAMSHKHFDKRTRVRIVRFALAIVILLPATALSQVDSTIVRTVCADALPMTWNGHTFTLADSVGTDGTNILLSHTDTLPSSLGADSIVMMNVTVKPVYHTYDTIIICPGEPYRYHNTTYDGPTEIDISLLSVQDCDSTVHVVLRPRDTTFNIRAYHRFAGDAWQHSDSILVGCKPNAVFLKDSTANAYSSAWTVYLPDTTIIAGKTVSITIPDNSDTIAAIAMLIVESEGQCFDTAVFPIVALSKPIADFVWAPEMPAMHNPEAQFYDRTTPTYPLSHLWQIQQQEGGDFDTTSQASPLYHWGQPGDNIHGDIIVRDIAYLNHSIDRLEASNIVVPNSLQASVSHILSTLSYPLQHACPDTAEKTIVIINDYLQFPNLVTPNGDGDNDTWRVVNLLEMGFYPTNELWIYNRWGILVHHVRNISTESDFWDPNEKNMPDGTYFYRFDAKSPFGSVRQHGIIEVLRN